MRTEILAKKPRTWKGRWQRIRQVLHLALVNFYREDSLMVSASIAYHCLLAVFPLLLLLLGLSGIFIRRYELSGELAMVLDRYLPMKADFIMRNLAGVSRAYGRVGLLSFLLLLWSSSGVFLPLERALNRAWGVEKARPWWRCQLLTLEMALIAEFLILVSSGLVGLNIHLHKWMQSSVFPHAAAWMEFTFHLILLSTTFGMTLAMFVVVFERLPNRPMRLRQVLPSALLTTVFWEAARSLFTLLLPFLNYRQVYGSIGIVVALMTWAYVSSAVTLFGAQVSYALYGTLESPRPIPASLSGPAPKPAGDVR